MNQICDASVLIIEGSDGRGIHVGHAQRVMDGWQCTARIKRGVLLSHHAEDESEARQWLSERGAVTFQESDGMK